VPNLAPGTACRLVGREVTPRRSGARKLINRESLRDLVLRQIREHGGFSVFWVTDRLAPIIDRLIRKGAIVSTGESSFPWNGFRVALDSSGRLPYKKPVIVRHMPVTGARRSHA